MQIKQKNAFWKVRLGKEGYRAKQDVISYKLDTNLHFVKRLVDVRRGKAIAKLFRVGSVS